MATKIQAIVTAIIIENVDIDIDNQHLRQRLFPGNTMLHLAAMVTGHAAVTGQLIAARYTC